MADRPITFSPAMVRALLAGTKTQTRRFLDAWSDEPPAFVEDGIVTAFDENYRPYRWPNTKAVGDRLYVREHWRVSKKLDGYAPAHSNDNKPILPIGTPLHYIADGGSTSSLITLEAMTGKFRQAMHMPKWASRITLHVTEVRVQRLNEIGHGDCMAEGVRHVPNQSLYDLDLGDGTVLQAMNPFGVYHQLMDRLHGDGFWASNPWVTATSFEVERCHIDQARAA